MAGKTLKNRNRSGEELKNDDSDPFTCILLPSTLCLCVCVHVYVYLDSLSLSLSLSLLAGRRRRWSVGGSSSLSLSSILHSAPLSLSLSLSLRRGRKRNMFLHQPKSVGEVIRWSEQAALFVHLQPFKTFFDV